MNIDKKMTWLCFLLMLLCAVDGFVTIYAVEAGFAEELNPLMSILLGLSATLFFVIKMLVTAVCAGVLFYYRNHSQHSGLMLRIVTSLVVMYVFLMAYHTYGLLFLV